MPESDDDGGSSSGGLNTNADRFLSFSRTLSSPHSFSVPFLVVLLLLLRLLPFFVSIWRTYKSETAMSSTGGKERERERGRTRVKDDCMSNLRHGD